VSGALGLVIAGGGGQRLGAGRPKALAALAGRTLLERAIATLESLAGEVRVVAPAALALPVPAARLVADDGHGPLAALAAGFAAAGFDRAYVLGVDLPLCPPALLAALAARAGEGAAMAAADGREQPLVSVWRPAAARALAARASAGERALCPAARAAGALACDVAALGFAPGVLLNVNTPGDLAAAVRALEGVRP
jgi:molybdopterin-guanine dinucleotide biosynthesis protein A